MIKEFQDLTVWQKAHELALVVYSATQSVRIDKKDFGLADQMRRAAVSVPSNIAEGFGRVSRLEKIRFYYIAKGSLTELHCQLILCRDLGYINPGKFQKLEEDVGHVRRLINGSVRGLT